MINKIYSYIAHNFYELVVTFFLFTNLYPYTFPSWMYFIGIFLIAVKFLSCNTKVVGRWHIIGFFLLAIWFSTVVNMAYDLRPILFTVIVLLASPFITSLRWHLFKKKLMRNIFIGFAITVLVSVYAKLTGVNYQVMIRMMGESMEQYGKSDEFSGFAKFPMWNSAAAALSTLYFAFLLIKSKSNRKLLKLFYLVMLFTSFYICVISASRTAAAFSAFSCLLLLKWMTRRVQKMLKYLVTVGAVGLLLLPVFIEGADRMMQKQKYQAETGVTSRDELWEKRGQEFKSSPIWGVGFAVNGTGADRKIGRDESGSSWYAILAQTGIIGLVLALCIWLKSYSRIGEINYDKFNLLVLAALLFFTVHSIFEGYMFQGGWYMCIICWMCVGIVNEAKMYRKKIISNVLNN